MCLQDISSNALRARALWLIGACGSDLPQNLWEEALLLVAQHMQASDLVVALTAVAALMPLLTIILEEEQVKRNTPTQRLHLLQQGPKKSYKAQLFRSWNNFFNSIKLCSE